MKKVILRRSIDLRELGDLGLITDDSGDLPTSGAAHRGSLGATSATRTRTDLSTITDRVVVDTQDMGLVTEGNGTITHDFAYADVAGPYYGEADALGSSTSTPSAPAWPIAVTSYTPIVRPSLGAYDSFSYHGFSISMNDTHLAVGAYGAAEAYATRNSGAVAIYQLSDGMNTEVRKGSSLSQLIGQNVEVSGSTLYVWQLNSERVQYSLSAEGTTAYQANISSTPPFPNGTQTLTAESTSYTAVSDGQTVTITDKATSEVKYTIDVSDMNTIGTVYIIMNDNYLVAKYSYAGSPTGYDYALRIYPLT